MLLHACRSYPASSRRMHREEINKSLLCSKGVSYYTTELRQLHSDMPCSDINCPTAWHVIHARFIHDTCVYLGVKNICPPKFCVFCTGSVWGSFWAWSGIARPGPAWETWCVPKQLAHNNVYYSTSIVYSYCVGLPVKCSHSCQQKLLCSETYVIKLVPMPPCWQPHPFGAT